MARRTTKAATTLRETATACAARPDVAELPPPASVVLGGQRRIVLPPEVTQHVGVEVGDRITYFFEPDGTIRLKSKRAVVESFIGILAEYGNGHEVDDFLAERREEARREDERWQSA